MEGEKRRNAGERVGKVAKQLGSCPQVGGILLVEDIFTAGAGLYGVYGVYSTALMDLPRSGWKRRNHEERAAKGNGPPP
jgi:hypothetical protein